MPIRGRRFQRNLDAYVEWCNAHRPHSALDGRVPDEAYHGGSVQENAELGDKVIQIVPLHGRRNLPVIRLVDAA